MAYKQQISGNFISTEYSGFTRRLNVNYLSATTIFGNISSIYVGTGSTLGDIPNWVTDVEFSYLSGITGSVQTQINSKLPLDTPLITYQTDNRLTDYKILTNAGVYQEIPHFHIHLMSNQDF